MPQQGEVIFLSGVATVKLLLPKKHNPPPMLWQETVCNSAQWPHTKGKDVTCWKGFQQERDGDGGQEWGMKITTIHYINVWKLNLKKVPLCMLEFEWNYFATESVTALDLKITMYNGTYKVLSKQINSIYCNLTVHRTVVALWNSMFNQSTGDKESFSVSPLDGFRFRKSNEA